MMALTRMAETARELGLAPLVLGDALEGEAREVGTVMAGIARSIRAHGASAAAARRAAVGRRDDRDDRHSGPAGHGGRNTEFLLALAVALDGAADIWAVAGDTDGLDGMDDIAGAIVTPDTLGARPRQGA